MAGGGGAWKVAYADFVTAMMAFFLVMWITSQGQDVKQAIAGYFQDPWGTSSEFQAPASLLPSEMHGDAQSLTMPEKLPHGKKPGIADSDEKNADARAQSRWAQNRKVHFTQDRITRRRLWCCSSTSVGRALAKSIEQLNRLLPVLLGKQNRVEVRGHSTRRPLPAGQPVSRSLATLLRPCRGDDEVPWRSTASSRKECGSARPRLSSRSPTASSRPGKRRTPASRSSCSAKWPTTCPGYADAQKAVGDSDKSNAKPPASKPSERRRQEEQAVTRSSQKASRRQSKTQPPPRGKCRPKARPSQSRKRV